MCDQAAAAAALPQAQEQDNNEGAGDDGDGTSQQPIAANDTHVELVPASPTSAATAAGEGDGDDIAISHARGAEVIQRTWRARRTAREQEQQKQPLNGGRSRDEL